MPVSGCWGTGLKAFTRQWTLYRLHLQHAKFIMHQARLHFYKIQMYITDISSLRRGGKRHWFPRAALTPQSRLSAI